MMKNTIRAEDENKYKQTNKQIMETQNAKLLFSSINFGQEERDKN